MCRCLVKSPVEHTPMHRSEIGRCSIRLFGAYNTLDPFVGYILRRLFAIDMPDGALVPSLVVGGGKVGVVFAQCLHDSRLPAPVF